MFNLSKIIPLAVLFLIYIVATVSAQGGGDVDVSDFNLSVGSGFNANTEFNRGIFPRCRNARNYCSRRDRRSYFTCRRGRYIRISCPRGTFCSYRNGRQVCSRIR